MRFWLVAALGVAGASGNSGGNTGTALASLSARLPGNAGSATAAQLDFPTGLTVDGQSGNAYTAGNKGPIAATAVGTPIISADERVFSFDSKEGDRCRASACQRNRWQR